MGTYRHLVLRYGCDRPRLSRELQDAFVELDADASTRAWIDHAIENPQSAAITAARNAAMKSVSRSASIRKSIKCAPSPKSAGLAETKPHARAGDPR